MPEERRDLLFFIPLFPPFGRCWRFPRSGFSLSTLLHACAPSAFGGRPCCYNKGNTDHCSNSSSKKERHRVYGWRSTGWPASPFIGFAKQLPVPPVGEAAGCPMMYIGHLYL
ncbi:hypothetical protein K440DRAFT_83298 [Wilcoxina mikolae CBS 423.85]|nr:hypothetical protein K440DRAFT_83298 [Wilcoxina mikolae CBS 423.85]